MTHRPYRTLASGRRSRHLFKMPTIVASAPSAAGSAAALARRGAWVFDLDNTLYPARCDLFAQVDVRIRDYVAGFLGLDTDAAYRLQKTYFRDHGTTLSGMMRHHRMDPGPYLAYVHDIDLSPVPPDPLLAAALAALPGRKIVFTNGSARHAERVMERLGVAPQFEAIFDIAAAGYVPKPEPSVYDALVRRHGLAAGDTVMVEDIARNLAPAARLGMTTVWVRTDGRYSPPDAPDGAGRQNHDPDPAAAIDHVVDDLPFWLAALTGIAPGR